VVPVFRSVFAGRKDLDEKIGEPCPVILGYLPLASALHEPEYLPRGQRSEGQKRVEEIIVGNGRANHERRATP
jgi:hypothetical protein